MDIWSFHSGLSYLKLRPNEYQADIYVGSTIYYSLIFSDHTTLAPGGTLSCTGYGYDHPDYGMDAAHLTTLLNEAYGTGKIPHLELIIDNWRDLTPTHCSNFLSRLAGILAGREVSFSWCREMNGGTPNWAIPGPDYARICGYWRDARDSLGLTNIVLTSHVELAPGWDASWNPARFTAWLDGVRLLDVIGASAYANDPAVSFQRAQLYYAMVGQRKPFMFLEFNTFSSLSGGARANADYILRAYGLLEGNDFVKAFDWWMPIDYSPTAGQAFREMTTQYDGFTPTASLLPLVLGLLTLIGIIWLARR